MIELVNLCKTYKTKNRKKTHALKNISLVFPDNGFIFITGKSGSGKSTLLNLIGGLDDITSGDVIINGNNLSKFKVNDFANYRSTYVGFIFQDYHILDEFTVKENIELSSDISNKSCDLEKWLKFVDLEGYEDRYPTELSGGQQQRVAIARALAKDSKIILADEPTGNLDVKTTKQILDILKEISKTRLVLIVSHNLDDAAIYADRIISLDHGNVIHDLSRIEGYSNEFRIENNTLFLPHNADIKEEDLKLIIDNKDSYNSIVQLDGGLVKTEEVKVERKNEAMNKSKLSKEKFKKLFNLIFRRKVFSKVLTILLISILISLFSVFQSFNAFDENEKLMDHLIEENENVLIVKKNTYNGKKLSQTFAPVKEEDYNAFKETSYKGNIYKLYNHTVNVVSASIMTLTDRTIASNIQAFYAQETYGTLNCDEEFLINLYGKDGKLDILAGDPFSTEYGVVITDYIADSILFYNSSVKGRPPLQGYEDIIGVFPKGPYSYNKSGYINAIINTNYKERYKKILEIYANLWDDDPSNDNVSDEIKDNPLFKEFSNEVHKYLGISYNFSKEYEKHLYSTNTMIIATLGGVKFTSGDIESETLKTVNYIQGTHLKKNLEGNHVIMTTTLYNNIFGTNYNKDNLSEFVPCEVDVYRNLNKSEYFKQKVYVEGLVVGAGTALYTSDELFIDFLKHKLIPYALYFDSINHIEELSKVIKTNGFGILNDETSGIAMVNRVIRIFGTFLDIISIVFLLVCIVYLMHFGYKSIKNNMYEIGIITALGCDNTNMGKLFVYEILSVGIGIIITSFIGMYIAAIFSNVVLIESFEHIFKYSLSSVNIITFNISYAVIDLIIAMIIIVISALFPLYMIRKIKPVNILKAKE